MAGGFADHLLAAGSLRHDAGKISHAPGWDEQRGFTPEDFRGSRLETIDGGIFQINVVAHLGLRHGLPHRQRRSGYGITTKVNDPSVHFHSNRPSISSLSSLIRFGPPTSNTNPVPIATAQ